MALCRLSRYRWQSRVTVCVEVVFRSAKECYFRGAKDNYPLIWNMEILSMPSHPVNGNVSSRNRFHAISRVGIFHCLSAVVVATTFSGCAGMRSCKDYVGSCKNYVHNGFKVGPEYCKPAAPVADSWIDEYDERVRTELPNYADWWSVFNDPVLDRLMEETYQQNLDLKAAGLRVLQSRYIRSIAMGGFFPQSQEAFGSYTRSQNSQNIAGGLLPLNTNTWATGFDVFWELDVWGKFRRNIESADASLDASVEDYDAILISLLAETASTYVDLRTAQQRLEYGNPTSAFKKAASRSQTLNSKQQPSRNWTSRKRRISSPTHNS
jgi:hypothetical protein